MRLRRALTQLPVVLEGGTTNKGFLLDLLDRDEVRAGQYDTAWLDRLAATGETAGHEHGDVAVLMAAIDAYDDGQRIEPRRSCSPRRGAGAPTSRRRSAGRSSCATAATTT